MTDFTFTSPQGKSYTVTGPAGATKEQAFQMLQTQLSGAPEAPAAPPSPNDIPGATTPKPAPEQPSSFTDKLMAPLEAGRAMIQNPLAAGLSGAQAAIESLARGNGLKADPRADARGEELTRQRSYQPTNPAAQKLIGAIGDVANSDAVQSLQAFGPTGGVLGEAGVLATGAARQVGQMAGSAGRAAGAVAGKVPAAVGGAVRSATGAARQVGQMAGSAGRAAGAVAGKVPAAVGGAVRSATGSAEREAAAGLKSTITGEASKAADVLEKQAKALSQARAPAAERDIAGARSTVANKLRDQAATTQAHLDALKQGHVSDEQIGALIQNKGTANIDALKADREKSAITDIKDPAFEFGAIRAEAGDTLSTNPASKPYIDAAISDIKKALADTPEAMRGNMEKMIESITGGKQGLTLAQGEYLRRWSGDANLRESSGFSALNDARLKDLNKNLTAAMKAYEKDVGRYLDTYKAKSEGIDRAVGSNVGKAATDSIVGEGEDVVRNQKPQQAARYYLDGTKNAADKLVALVGGKSDELVASVSGNLTAKMQDMSAKQAAEFARKNEGLLKTFPEAAPLVREIVKSKESIERLNSMVTKAGTRAEQASDAATKSRDAVRRTADAPREAARQMRVALEKLDKAPNKETLATAERLADGLAKKGLIDGQRYQELLTQIRETDRIYGKTQDAKRILHWIVAGAVGTAGVKALGSLGAPGMGSDH